MYTQLIFKDLDTYKLMSKEGSGKETKVALSSRQLSPRINLLSASIASERFILCFENGNV